MAEYEEHKAVIYARVSSKEQEREGYSIPAQLKLLKEYAQRMGFSILHEYVDVETAKRTGRSSFSSMIKFLREDRKRCVDSAVRCRTILVEKTDRLYRNFADYVTLDDLDVEMHLVKENEVLSWDSRSSTKFAHGIKVLMAKNYVDNLSEEVRKGQMEKCRQGFYPSIAPIGYRNIECDGRHIIQPDPDEAPIVRKMFELYATGRYSIQELVGFMRHEGLVTRRRGDNYKKATVHRILTNPIYYGEFRWKGTLYDGKHTPIISRGLFEEVQSCLRERNRHPMRNSVQTAHVFRNYPPREFGAIRPPNSE